MTNVEMVELEENVLIVVIFNFVVIGFIWFENVTYVFVSSSPIGSRSIGLPGHCYYDTRVISLITVRLVHDWPNDKGSIGVATTGLCCLRKFRNNYKIISYNFVKAN